MERSFEEDSNAGVFFKKEKVDALLSKFQHEYSDNHTIVESIASKEYDLLVPLLFTTIGKNADLSALVDARSRYEISRIGKPFYCKLIAEYILRQNAIDSLRDDRVLQISDDLMISNAIVEHFPESAVFGSSTTVRKLAQITFF